VIVGTGVHTTSPEPLDLDQLSEEMLDSFTDLSHGSRLPARVDVDLGVRDGADLFRVSATVAIAGNGQVYAVTDNDGLGDATGETVFLRLGAARTVSRGC
jgi:hypothetical protein